MNGQVKCCFPRRIIAAVAKSARILRRKRDCPGQWTLGCMISLHSQALCVWESWTSLLRVSGVEKGQLACRNPCQGSGKSVTEPRSQFCICTAQHIHQSPVLLVVLQTLSAWLCSELERCHRLDLIFASHSLAGRQGSFILASGENSQDFTPWALQGIWGSQDLTSVSLTCSHANTSSKSGSFCFL